jgi:hypothetical protein
MTIGPLEYLVIDEPNDRLADEIAPLLAAIHDTEAVRVVDLLFIRKDARGNLTAQEVNDLPDEKLVDYERLAGGPWGLLTAEDVTTLASGVPAGGSAVILLLEHAWTVPLTDAIKRTGGAVIAGGMVAPEAVRQLNENLNSAAR